MGSIETAGAERSTTGITQGSKPLRYDHVRYQRASFDPSLATDGCRGQHENAEKVVPRGRGLFCPLQVTLVVPLTFATALPQVSPFNAIVAQIRDQGDDCH